MSEGNPVMRRALLTTSFVLVVAALPFGCADILGVDEPVFDPSITGDGAAGNAGGKGGMGGAGGMAGSSGGGSGGAGGTDCKPTELTCDGVDDDCNGQIDDLPLLTCGTGVCQVTVPACVDGKLSECIPGPPTPDELCDGDNDGIDDNCNGQIDEGCPCTVGQTEYCYSGSAETRNVGVCKDGTQTCTGVNEWGPCTGDVLPTLEMCNGDDDDCNALVDDGFGETTCGVGACQVTVPNCVPGGPPPECMPTDPTNELCNGLDDDCDGTIDNGNPESGMSCMTGLSGPCATGTTQCDMGTLVCNPTTMPIAEVCNNVDDDCDGTIDDGNPGGGNVCPTGQLGECANGATACLSGSLVCIAPMPAEDVCDGLDNDCDGEADNHGVGLGIPCMTGIPGECATGFTTCDNGALTCNPSKTPQAEVCDNKDNDCDGTVDEDNPGGGATCTVVGKKGACAVGAIVCQVGIFTCTQTVQPTTEVCDGVDNDCDGDVDEGAAMGCGTCGTAVVASSACASMSLPAPVTLSETCKQVFPAPAATSIPVTIGNPGTQYYVKPTGNDSNDGKTPGTAWGTLCKALAMVGAGNTIQVAQGAYLSSEVIVAKGVTVKGGYNASFTLWNPEQYPTIFYGRLTLDHASAVWGGFRMIANPISSAQSRHSLKSGSFVRNYVETVFGTGVSTQSSAMNATACPGASLSLIGNDIYAGGTNATPLRAIGFDYQKGAVILDSNRVCAQGKAAGQAFAVNGFGPNTANAGSLLLRNNLLETANGGGYVIFLAGQGGGVDFTTTMTNNTLLAWESGVGGTEASNNGKMRWRMTNNILFNLNGSGTSAALGSGSGVSFDGAENNLVFGFSTNAFSQPTPTVNLNNDWTNTTNAAAVFINAVSGDFRINVNGKADELGKNVFNVPAYGDVTTDLYQSQRPMMPGAWDRGALKN